jgi:hypothetical protein
MHSTRTSRHILTVAVLSAFFSTRALAQKITATISISGAMGVGGTVATSTLPAFNPTLETFPYVGPFVRHRRLHGAGHTGGRGRESGIGGRVVSGLLRSATSGEVLHSAVWRPETHEEKVFFGLTYADYKAKYDEIFPQGWRLYILNTYVLSNGDLRYDAVWRLGTIDRPL